MEGLTQQESLKRIARYLQEQLPPQTYATPLHVQCALKEGLMVLVQHPPGNAPPDPQQIFTTLEKALASLPIEWIAPLPNLHNSKARLFLRVLGQQKPYVHHVGLIAPPATITPSSIAPSSPVAPSEATIVQSSNPSHQAGDDKGELVHTPETSLDVLQPAPLAHPPKPAPQKRVTVKWQSLTKPLLLATGGIAAAAVVGMGAYALTRPCVVGGCANLETAQALTERSTQTLAAGKLEESAQQLEQARQLVAQIPPWSSQYGNAQALQQALDQVLAAEAKAQSASQRGQTTAQPVTEWQAVQSLWREAIAGLEAMPQDSSLAAFAQARLALYRANLTFTDQRIAAEQDAGKRLASARKTAELAIARQNTAQQLQDWQQAQATWQVAVNTLTQIPNGTTGYTEAQQLLANYGSKLTETRNHTIQEQQANKAYIQATRLEKQAKNLQQANQWSQAMTTWRNALNAAKQVPDGTSFTSQAQILASTYASSLQQAETVVKVRGDLERVCFASGKICDYTLKNEIIEVRFVPSYERKVRTLGGISSYSGDYEAMYGINRHLASLGDALQAISNNAGIPIQVYNSDNQLLGSFAPGGDRVGG